MSACNCAYGIDEKGVFTPPAPYFDAAGFTAAPTTIADGKGKINAALVGTNGDGIVVAFRGTLVATNIKDLPSLLDWAQNFEASPTAVADMPGQVHSGFWRGLDTIWGDVLAAVKAILAVGEQPVYLTGHSKGGALAHLAAMCFKAAGIMPAEVCTFAAPRMGDAAFAAAYDQAISAYRYEYTDDIVPHLPPDLAFLTALKPFLGNKLEALPVFDYVSVGTLRFIDWDQQIVGDSKLLQVRRLAHLASLIVEANIASIVADHHADCGHGYMTQVCPVGVCPTATPGGG